MRGDAYPRASQGVRTPTVLRTPRDPRWPIGPTLVLDEPTLPTPSYREFLEALGVAVYTTDADGRITFYNPAAVELWGRSPDLGERWCGWWKLFWPNGEPMAHGECPMAIALKEGRSVRGYEGIAERPDGTRVAFAPYPTVVTDSSGKVLGAINVVVDVTDRRMAEDRLRAAIAVKDEFLGLVSHELRTPVTTILGNAQLLAVHRDVSEPVRAQLLDLAAEAERLAGMVENLLVLTRTGMPIDVDREPEVLERVVRGAVADFTRHHPERDIRIRGQMGGSVVDADRAYVELVLGNLLANAQQYSAPDARIDVDMRRDGDALEVRVLDRGIGFPPDDAEQLFATFYRTNAAQKMASGLGIGLSACRRLVELLGGRIWAAPRPNGGSEFGFALPALADTD